NCPITVKFHNLSQQYNAAMLLISTAFPSFETIHPPRPRRAAPPQGKGAATTNPQSKIINPR
ncbi:MAG: hypothetical protein PVG32_10880, partial [Anaerolineales bacterium]